MDYLSELYGEISSVFVGFFLLSPLFSDAIFLSRLRKRSHFVPLAFLSLLLYLSATVFLGPLLYQLDPRLPWVGDFIFLTLCTWIAFDHNILDLLFCSICGFAIGNSVNMVTEIILEYSNGTVNWFVIHLPILLFADVLCYLFIAKRLKKNSNILMRNYLVFPIAILLLILIAGYLNYLPSDSIRDDIERLLFRITLNAVIVLLLLAYKKNKDLVDEQEVMEKLIAKGDYQFEQMRNYMEIIDIKCHDMKKMMDKYPHEEGANSQIASELAQSMEEYRNMPKTNNNALDVVLYDKIIVCRKKGITLTYIVDGKAMDFMKSLDIATLFNNLLFNAMEYVSKFKENDKKIISMNVHQKNNFLFITVENYFEGALKLINGLPTTTKDEKNHGYGLKSVKYTIDQYKGVMNVSNKDNLFIVDILIPIAYQKDVTSNSFE